MNVLGSPIRAAVLYVALDVLCVGMGMGVPIFCIALGFPTGWVLAGMVARRATSFRKILRSVLKYAILTVIPTFLMMLAIWGPPFFMLFDPAADIANFGIPMWLFEPKASFIGWHVLMIVVSPFLQLLTTIFAAYLALCRITASGPGGSEDGGTRGSCGPAGDAGWRRNG